MPAMSPRPLIADVPMCEAEWPRLGSCPCGQEVLLARAGNDQVADLDPIPIIVGERPCVMCKGRGHRIVPAAKGGPRLGTEPGDLAGKMGAGSRTSCIDCGGTGVRGEELTDEHAVMTMAGVVRSELRLLAPWDSAYRRHAC